MHPKENKEKAQNNRPRNAITQNPVLGLLTDTKACEYGEKDKEVIHAQTQLNQITSQKFQRFLPAF